MSSSKNEQVNFDVALNDFHCEMIVKGNMPMVLLSTSSSEVKLFYGLTEMARRNHLKRTIVDRDMQLSLVRTTRYAIRYFSNPTDEARRLHMVLWEL